MKKQGDKVFMVLCQKWEESELGWGTRPDGYSLHLNDAMRQEYIKDVWSGMPDEVQAEYSRTNGTPYWCEVDEKTYREVEQSKWGIRKFHGPYPGSGGNDGWVPLRSGGYGKR